jgi:hypothetical protein
MLCIKNKYATLKIIILSELIYRQALLMHYQLSMFVNVLQLNNYTVLDVFYTHVIIYYCASYGYCNHVSWYRHCCLFMCQYHIR